MKKIIEKFKSMDSHQRNHILLRTGLVLFAIMVIYRFVAFGMMQHKSVVNLTRVANENGVPVSVVEMQRTNGIIYEPLFINNNRGYVSGMRVARFRAGQKITGGGEIVSVSNSLDLDSGMHIVRTRGASDGAHTVEIRDTGFFVPTYAVQNDTVFVVRDNVARAVRVSVVRGDADNTMITGVVAGDIVITSRVSDGTLVRVIK